MLSKQSEQIKENEKEIAQVKADCLRKDEEKDARVAEDLKREKRKRLKVCCILNPYLELLKYKLAEFCSDCSPLLAGEIVFQNVPVNKASVYDTLFSETDDPVAETYTQMALELAVGGMLLILERQVKDQLPGGKFYDPRVEVQFRASALPATNTCSERDFAQLDMLMRTKPPASTECYDYVIMWTNNKTSKWLSSLENKERLKNI